MKELIFGNWRTFAITSGVALLIGLASGGAAGYKIGVWFEHDPAYNEGVAAQKLIQSNEALKATQKAIGSRIETDHEISKLKNPDIIKLLHDNGWLRDPNDL